MRVSTLARAAACSLVIGLCSFNHAHAQAQAATLTPAAGQAVQVINGARVVAGGVIAGGYLITGATLEFIGGVGIRVGWRIAGGAAVAAVATSAIAPFVVGGLALGIGAAEFMNWLDRAHQSELAQEFFLDPNTGLVMRRGVPGTGYDEDLTMTADGRSITQAKEAYGDWLPQSCSLGCTAFVGQFGQGCGARKHYGIRNHVGNLVTAWCLSDAGPVLAGPTPDAVPTADDWERLAADLANVPVSPAMLQAMGKPIPVDPIPVINPPDIPNDDVLIGATNPAPTLGSRPQTIVGEATPVPGTSPQSYTQPTYVINPAPTATNPYGVTVITTVVNTTDPAVPTTPTAPGTANPSTPDVCAQNPTAMMCQPLGTLRDTPLPGVNPLYERKYPQGIVGIWQAKTAAMQQTSLFTFVGQLMPTGFVSGSCPSWSINLDFGPTWAKFGAHDIAPPCWLWDVAKAITIISALMLARQLIFGG